MSQVHLHRLYIVPVLQREDGKGVTQIMYSCVRCADFLRNLLEVQVCGFLASLYSVGIGHAIEISPKSSYFMIASDFPDTR